ncbi:hypothetical protein [Paragemmobacter straminiformis]|uniref:hypothetical protein n=1 Tax=Paragemmobacter straminiformis TaxID=2045119 RepID=UPI00163A8137|nr:hypothetical protein [Gemmobacter straminiformis]
MQRGVSDYAIASRSILWTMELSREVAKVVARYPVLLIRDDVRQMREDYRSGDIWTDRHDATLDRIKAHCRLAILQKLPAYAEVFDSEQVEDCELLDPELATHRQIWITVDRFKRIRRSAQDHISMLEALPCTCRAS